MADRDEPLTPSTQSRRDFLKKSAAAGAVLWAAPTVMSRPAFGQTGGSPVPCAAEDICTVNSNAEQCGESPNGRTCVTLNVNGECDCVFPRTISDPSQCTNGTVVQCSSGATYCLVPCELA